MSDYMNSANIGANAAAEAAETPAGGVSGGNVTSLSVPEKVREARTAGVYVHKFNKPFTSGGKTYDTLDFNFERLIGQDMIDIEIDMQMMNEFVFAPEISRSFQARLAGKAAGIDVKVIKNMPFKDFYMITNAAQSFLLDMGS